MKILDRYILRETLLPLAAGLGLFLFVLLMDRLFDMMDLVLNRGVEPVVVLRLLGCIVPSVIAVALPMATLMAAVLAFGRLAQDRELTAFKSAGVGLGRLIAPALGLGGAFSLLLLVFNGSVLPWATTEYKTIFFTIVRQRASVALQEQRFIREFDRYLLYFERKTGATDELEEVTIVETPPKPPRIIAARRGRLAVDPEGKRITLELTDGVMDQPADDEGKDYTRIEFATYAVDLDIHDALKGEKGLVKALDELTYGDLRRKIHDLRNVPDVRRIYEVALHQKVALAFAPLFVVLLGAPLGSLARRGGGIGLLISLLVIFAYYSLLTIGRGVADRGSVDPMLALWFPNAFLAATGALAYWAAAREARWMRRGR